MKLATKAILCSVLVIVICILTMPKVKADEFNVKSYLDKTYVTIGAGYKFQETNLKLTRNGVKKDWNEPVSARIEIYYQYSKNVTFGISHHSQWLTGFPFDDDSEYSKTELFVDYTFSLGDL